MHTFQKRTLCLLLTLVLLVGLALPAASARKETMVDVLLEEVQVPKVLGSGGFSYAGLDFFGFTIPQHLVERYEQSEFEIKPGQRDERVAALKKTINSDSANAPYFLDNELVSYSQMRPEVLDYFDANLATLIETIYLFCGLEGKEPVIDELTLWLVDQLKVVSAGRLPKSDPLVQEYEPILHDIEAVYKYKLTKKGLQGTIGRDGTNDGMYYYAQTDPDWAAEPFEWENNGDTIKDRGCGCACAAMVCSTYHKVEITPRRMAHYAIQDNWPVSYGLPDEYFPSIVEKYYSHLETERYGTVLETPKLLYKSDVDMTQLAQQIGEQGHLAIIHVKAGAFTSHEHYMVLADYEVIDGQGYFLVADPYILQSRYSDWQYLKKVDSGNEGLIYAMPEVIYRDMMAILLFEQDRNEFPLYRRALGPLPLVQEGG